MRAGEFPDGARTLRAKIDMSAPNIWLRDPVLYRIRHASHHHTGDAWCIYPMYDFAHGLSDYIEGITHSICTLEFEVHRPLYDWILEALDLPRVHPRQREFARLNVTYTIMSKRRLLRLVQEGRVRGWDDPRMPTISGMRRRGYPAEAIRAFCDRIGVAKRENMVRTGPAGALRARRPQPARAARHGRAAAAQGGHRELPRGPGRGVRGRQQPRGPSAGTRKVPFSKVVYIEQDDFREVPPPKYHRLSPGVEVRLRSAYLITCTGVVEGPADRRGRGGARHLRPGHQGGDAPDGRKVKSTIHWVSAAHALDAEVRLYDTLFTVESPDNVPEGADFIETLNPDSLEVLHGCKLEPSLAAAAPGARYQFERLGYFCADPEDSQAGRAGVQPHGDAQGRLGQDREEAGLRGAGLSEQRRRAAAACERRLGRTRFTGPRC